MNIIKIIGFGNILMYDDGIGVNLINELKIHPEFQNDKIQLIDAGVCSLDIIEEINNYDKVIIIDAVSTKMQPPGTVYVFSSKEIKRYILQHKQYISLHDINLFEILKYILEKNNIELLFIGIEVKEIKQGIGLSNEIKHCIPKVVNIIKQKVKGYLLERNYDCNSA